MVIEHYDCSINIHHLEQYMFWKVNIEFASTTVPKKHNYVSSALGKFLLKIKESSQITPPPTRHIDVTPTLKHCQTLTSIQIWKTRWFWKLKWRQYFPRAWRQDFQTWNTLGFSTSMNGHFYIQSRVIFSNYYIKIYLIPPIKFIANLISMSTFL